ncbi:AfsR/SARP family transcriptional regulator [Actinocatenispora sera]|uniref:Regulatory protein AfsR n=1 Tax=Actinocatenispora sera TaxID=390989 RepID=A0A810L8I0_9ACTN|nr:AfsR/SARP family transcriptional regulator [Actinocatenispora sera]BCJ31547.1 regulatory protein AfsR [Actinocatenispora sera]
MTQQPLEMAPLFGILGPLYVRINGTETAVGAAKLRALLAILLLRSPRIVTIDEMTDLLWEDRLPRKTRAALNTYIGRLRQMLGPIGSRIRTAPTGYAIDARADELDLTRFLRLRAAGQEEIGKGNLAQAVRILRSALGLWRGAPLVDVTSSRLQREDSQVLAQLRVAGWEMCLDAEIARGRPQEALEDLNRLIATCPLHERFHEQRVAALHQMGRRADALAAYQAARTVFVAELGVEPGASLQRLQQEILAESVAPSIDPVGRTSRSAVVPAQLPADIADFTGRAEWMDTLGRSLAVDPGFPGSMPTVAVLTGAGGAGKTTLAVHLGHRTRARFPDGQLYISMRGSSQFPLDSADVAARLLRDLGVDPASVPTDRSERYSLYRSLLANRRALLVFDDVRDTAQLRPLLPGSTRSAVIATSRNDLVTLPANLRVDLDVMDDDNATALFTSIVGRERTDAEPAAVREVLRACAGLPLAIRIVAVRIAANPAHPIGAMAGRLTNARSRLDQFEVDDLGVRASFGISYTRLPADTAAAESFRALGLWPGPDLGSAGLAALTGRDAAATELAADTLVSSHLLQCTATGRYHLHDLLHVYAREQAERQDGPGDRDAAVTRLLAWYLHTAANAADLIRPHHLPIPAETPPAGTTPLGFADDIAALDWCRLERANLLTAVQLAASVGADRLAWRLALTLWSYYYLDKNRDDWTAASEIGLACARRAGDRRAEGALLACLGTALCESRRYTEAIEHYRQALELHRATGDTQREPVTMNSLAVVYGELGKFALARDMFAEVRASHVRSGSRQGVGLATANLALCLAELGDHDAAVRHYREALDIYREIGDRYGEATTLGNLGLVYESVGAHRLATEALTDAFRRYEAAGNRHGQAQTMVMLGRCQNRAGDRAAARRSWRTAVRIFDELHDPGAAEPRELLRGLDAAPG